MQRWLFWSDFLSRRHCHLHRQASRCSLFAITRVLSFPTQHALALRSQHQRILQAAAPAILMQLETPCLLQVRHLLNQLVLILLLFAGANSYCVVMLFVRVDLLKFALRFSVIQVHGEQLATMVTLTAEVNHLLLQLLTSLSFFTISLRRLRLLEFIREFILLCLLWRDDWRMHWRSSSPAVFILQRNVCRLVMF